MAAFCGHGEMENFKLKSFDGTELYCYLFDKVENPKGVVMVVHGMGEHMGRYIHFAEYLNSRGYIVSATTTGDTAFRKPMPTAVITTAICFRTPSRTRFSF